MDTLETSKAGTPTSRSRSSAVEALSELVANDEALTRWVLRSVAGTPDPRLRQVVEAFIRHSHALIREVKPTAEEYETALRYMVDLGKRTDATRNEMIIFADMHGLSTLVDMLSHGESEGETAPALLGPFYRADAPWKHAGDTIAAPSADPELHVAGQVRSLAGAPLAGAVLDVWQSSPVGLYENQDPEQPDMNLRGRFHTDPAGRFHFRSVCPAGYPIPTDGPIGTLLRAENRHPFRPAHLHFLISAPEHRTLITQIFVDGDERLTSDVAFGSSPHLIGEFQRHDAPDPKHPDRQAPFYTLDYDFVLQPGVPSFPLPPIP